MFEKLRTSQLAERTIFQMHVYIKIKAEIKIRPRLAWEIGPHRMPLLSALSLRKWLLLLCKEDSDNNGAHRLSMPKGNTFLKPQEGGAPPEPLALQGTCLSNVTGSRDSSERCFSPRSSPIVTPHTVSRWANFRS